MATPDHAELSRLVALRHDLAGRVNTLNRLIRELERKIEEDDSPDWISFNGVRVRLVQTEWWVMEACPAFDRWTYEPVRGDRKVEIAGNGRDATVQLNIRDTAVTDTLFPVVYTGDGEFVGELNTHRDYSIHVKDGRLVGVRVVRPNHDNTSNRDDEEDVEQEVGEELAISDEDEQR